MMIEVFIFISKKVVTRNMISFSINVPLYFLINHLLLNYIHFNRNLVWRKGI